VESNLLSHHLDVLEVAGFVERTRSHGDGRRRYIHLAPGALEDLVPTSSMTACEVLFVCTHNSARSQLAAALWQDIVGAPATSAGTHPADAVHPGAVAAAQRVGLDLSDAQPQALLGVAQPELVVTVCDQAHEELPVSADWLHWSIPDPATSATRSAFDGVVAELQYRIAALTGRDAA
jgi:protein-tyrosine-phosphatase